MLVRLLVLLLFGSLMIPSAFATSSVLRLSELKQPVTVIRDIDGIPHIYAKNEHDLFLMQGYIHARDRFFQMDVLRRQASGTLATLLGPSVLSQDVELRIIGLRRAAERSWDITSHKLRKILQAYAAGVNQFLDHHPLPPEYAELEITRVEHWTPIDSLAIAKLLSFGLSFDLGDIQRTLTFEAFQSAGEALDFSGEELYFEDIFRSAPFDPASTVPDANYHYSSSSPNYNDKALRQFAIRPDYRTLFLAQAFIKRVRSLPFFQRALNRADFAQGSNEWAVSGRFTKHGLPLMANDPHLALGTPSTFYQNHLVGRRVGFDAIGSSFPGVPLVILGQNRHITWGATFNALDVTDVYRETIESDLETGELYTVHDGGRELITPLPQTFKFNVIGDEIDNNIVPAPPADDIPPAVLIVERRNNGPILSLNLLGGTALSLQYTGFSGTRELEALYEFNRARNLRAFKAALQKFDVGSQNFAYADIHGNIAYFTSAEMPIREDLQAITNEYILPVPPPFFIRNGQGGNDWLPVQNPQPFQAVPYEILPFDEMPQIENQPAGFFINANNDPIGNTWDNNVFNQQRPGGGIFYLSPGYAIGTRAGRITEMLENAVYRGDLTLADMQAIQADVVMLDAQVFIPYILEAFDQLMGATTTMREIESIDLGDLLNHNGVQVAVERFRRWDYSTPIGVKQGYDSSDPDGMRPDPSATQVEASISASIYAVWRAQIIANTIDKTLATVGLGSITPDDGRSIIALRNMLDNFDDNLGIGASGLDFFAIEGVDDSVMRRNIIIVRSLKEALDLMAGPDFISAFGNSTDQDDYRWGRLHRIVFEHPLGDYPSGDRFNIPPAGGAFPPSFIDLAGIATDGGFGVVDASSHSARAAGSNEFMFSSGPVRRYVGQIRRWPLPIQAETILPGGSSGVLGSPHYADLLGRWLTNDTYPVRQSIWSVFKAIETIEVYKPK